MPRTRFLPSRKTLLLAVLMAALIGGAWWWMKPPPEPVYKGMSLSWWLFSGQPGERDAALQSMGAPAVKGLAGMVEKGLADMAKDRWHREELAEPPMIQWMRGRLLPRRRSYYEDRLKCVTAAGALNDFGAEAEPAIPALLKALDSDDEYVHWTAACALNRMGSVSLPAVRETIAHGSTDARSALMQTLRLRLDDPARPASDPDVDFVLETILTACHGSVPDVQTARRAAPVLLGEILSGSETHLSRFAPLVIRRLGDVDPNVSLMTASALNWAMNYGSDPVAILMWLLRYGGPTSRIAAAETLVTADREKKQSAAALLEMTRDPDPECREAAKRALRALGISARVLRRD